MKINEEQRSDHTVLQLQGSLKLGDASRAFAARIDKIATEGRGALILDLSELDSLDSTGVGLLVAALRRFQESLRDFVLVNPQRRVLTGLQVTHLDSLFSIHESVPTAVAALARKEEEQTSEY
ncbi:MAG: STAS domain-containing protein [Thermoanaerobaculia bacterium]